MFTRLVQGHGMQRLTMPAPPVPIIAGADLIEPDHHLLALPLAPSPSTPPASPSLPAHPSQSTTVGWQLSYETLHAGGWYVGEYNSQRRRVQIRSWCGVVWGGDGLIATSPRPFSDPTAAADTHAHVEQSKRRGRFCNRIANVTLLPVSLHCGSCRPTKLTQQGRTCWPVGNLTQLLQTSCSILGRTLDDYKPHIGGTHSWANPP
ncbi:hypothetical protein HaLaN_14994 [Haematococcus lacustris]|uniref:Uncharacterized protein n=1 Tax=Haematococcus lacustris TaxID=44745 RepID=A0A699ZHH2_HAELA|nr:hypothetical protein HaLaN_14994 [Haematococcus lacustris]